MYDLVIFELNSSSADFIIGVFFYEETNEDESKYLCNKT